MLVIIAAILTAMAWQIRNVYAGCTAVKTYTSTPLACTLNANGTTNVIYLGLLAIALVTLPGQLKLAKEAEASARSNVQFLRLNLPDGDGSIRGARALLDVGFSIVLMNFGKRPALIDELALVVDGDYRQVDLTLSHTIGAYDILEIESSQTLRNVFGPLLCAYSVGPVSREERRTTRDSDELDKKRNDELSMLKSKHCVGWVHIRYRDMRPRGSRGNSVSDLLRIDLSRLLPDVFGQGERVLSTRARPAPTETRDTPVSSNK